MSELHNELPIRAADLDATSNAAMESLGLSPGNFAWFSGETRHPMEPQTILPDSNLELNHVTSSVTYYGGLAANSLGNFVCGHIHARIKEPIPEGAKHQSVNTVSPSPFIARSLNVHNGLITVDTPTMTPSLKDGPLVIQGESNPSFRNITVYDAQSGKVEVKKGEYSTKYGTFKDRTSQQDLFELSDDIVERRLATLLRTVEAAVTIFGQIASRKVTQVDWRIIEEPPFSTEPRR